MAQFLRAGADLLFEIYFRVVSRRVIGIRIITLRRGF